ncbi:hypothetical protein EDC62_1425 [Tibeticola sediminis]|uniref:BIG2 domain-containing protein n=1 Tax=Tibeticola sediminis TaxID=1917811 RepID=A0A3N4U9Z0_9BURK|nr:hypothetical protein [Tibeticola sediminis]RPE67546.1 hypothetical protein EDC62_1425 [Tibeticola sediminis]
MRLMHWMVALLAAVLVSACGGGGGSSGSDPKTPTVQTTAPATLSMPLGVVQSYSVFGGVAPYSVSSSDVRVLNASVSDQTLILNSVGQGNATVTIRDRNGGSAAVAITVGDPLTLSLSSVQTYVGDRVKVLISGGTPPYRVSTLEIALKGTIVGNELTLEMLSVGGPFDVVVLDARNQQVKMTVEKILAGSPQFNLVPASLSIPETSTESFTLQALGGVAPLTARSLRPDLLAVSVSGNIVTVQTGTQGNRCVSANTPVDIEVNDARGGYAKATITIINDPNVCGLSVSSSSVTVPVGGSVKVLLKGVSPTGTVATTSSSNTVATASYAAGFVTITGVAVGSATISVTDSGPPPQLATIAVTVVP